MPSRNILKQYLENGYYHLYSRGVDKREIFLDKQDCVVFQHYLRLYLSPPEELRQLSLLQPRINRFIPLNLYNEIDLLSFSIMPNHFHFEIRQHSKDAITKFMRRLLTSYSVYFNKKYGRIGPLFQSRFKAALIENESFLLHLSRYIHLNCRQVRSVIDFRDFSSYPYYIGTKHASWVKPEEILSYFRNNQRHDMKNFLSYQSFVEDYSEDAINILQDLVLEEEND